VSVEYEGKEYRVKQEDGLLTLDLSGLGISKITDIQGLEDITELQVLKLNRNQIKEINGLENLTKLENLQLEKNSIEKIQGLDTLVSLRELNLFRNEITEIVSFVNFEKLNKIYLAGNPIFSSLINATGEVTTQSIMKYTQMSVEERDRAINQKEEAEREYILQEDKKIEKAKKLSKKLILDEYFYFVLLIGALFGGLISLNPIPLNIALWVVLIATIIAVFGEVLINLKRRQKNKKYPLPVYSIIGLAFDAIGLILITLVFDLKDYTLWNIFDSTSRFYGLLDLNAIYSLVFLLLALLFNYLGFLKDSTKILPTLGAVITTITGVILLVPLVVIISLTIIGSSASF